VAYWGSGLLNTRVYYKSQFGCVLWTPLPSDTPCATLGLYRESLPVRRASPDVSTMLFNFSASRTAN
jgi:hypothetical protein